MEPTGPLGHAQWESEQPFPLGFLTLDSDNGGVPCQHGQDGLDYTDRDLDQTSRNTETGVFRDKSVDLDDLINNICDYSRAGLLFEDDQNQTRTEKNEGPDEITDLTLSWLFSPGLSDVVGKNFTELRKDSDTLSKQSSPSKVPDGTPETNPFLLVDLTNDSLNCLASGELDPQDASEELRQDSGSLSKPNSDRTSETNPFLLVDLPNEPPSLASGELNPQCDGEQLRQDLDTLSKPISDWTPETNLFSLVDLPNEPPSLASGELNPWDINEEMRPDSDSLSKSNSDRTSENNPFLLVDLLSNEPPCLTSGALNPQGVSEELVDLLEEEQAGPPPAQRETLSPETGAKGSFPDQVTGLSVTSSSPESCLQHNHETSFDGSVPLLDLEVPDCDGGLDSIISAKPLDLSTEESEVEVEHVQATATRNLNSERQGESESPSEPSSTTVEDAFTRGDFTRSESRDLMGDEAKDQERETMALDLCLATDEDVWDLKPLEGGQKEVVPGPAADQEEEEQEEECDINQDQGSDHHEAAPFEELSVSAPEAGWTSEQTPETVSLPEMVADDSLPVVPAGDTREEDVSPLKAVFDALDQDSDGFVRIEEFMEFAAAYGADQVKDLTKFLDPSGLGVISFEDFHRGISAISNGGPEPQLYNVNYSPGDGAVGCPEEYDEQNEVTDSAYLGSESTYSECETFTDEDTGALVPPEMHEDVETDSGIEATLNDPDESGNRFSLNSEHHNHSLVTVIGGEEEHFEDFGESNTSELLLESSMDGTKGDGDVLSQPQEQVNGSSLLSPSAPAPLPDCFQSFLREEALDFFCSQCHKQISRLEDLSTRLNFLEMTSAGKRLSSKKVARHLLQNSSMTLDTMSDLTRDILELADNDITDKVLLLERRVAELEKDSEASGEQHARLRQENLHLVHRANALEEQLKEQEVHTEEQMQQEGRRHKEALSKMEREKGLELENLQARLQQLDEENSELRSCVPCLRANIERLEEEKKKLQDETESMTDRLTEEMESRRKMADKLSHERHQNQKEKECTQELIEDLRKQLEHLQLYKLEAEAKRGRTPGAGLQEYQSRTREAELEQEIKRLKQDNRSLKEQNDELNGQIINLSIQGAKNLMSASFSDSLAAEINSVSRGELMEAIHKQEEINYRLQDYIDKIIVAIMESNPSILEVK